MRRRRPRAGGRTVVLTAGALATTALLATWLAASGAPVERATAAQTPPTPTPTSRDAPTPGRTSAALPTPRGAEARDVAALAPAASAPPDAADADAPSAARVDHAVAGLATALHDGPVDRHDWERRVRAVAASLGPGATARLRALAADGSLPDEALVAAAELLRPGAGAGGDPLPDAALAALRRTLQADPPAPGAAAAARSLGAFGAPDDRARLLDGLGDPGRRSLAAWGLRAVPDVTVLDALRTRLARGPDAGTRAAVLTTIAGWARDAAPGAAFGPVRDAAAASVAALVEDATLDAEERGRAAAALVALGGAPVRGVAESLCDDPSADDDLLQAGIARLAQDADPAALARLERGASHADAEASRRLAFAEGLARTEASAARSPIARRTLADLAASGHGQAGLRRRALYALGALAPDRDALAAATSALDDEDPAVRAAGAWAWERLGGAGAATAP